LENTAFLELDVTESASVVRSAREVSGLDVLINKAGVMTLSRSTLARRRTLDSGLWIGSR
jgi:NADP-dependent 3-hydroxy acid dehydrogenase YdfG